MLLAFFYARNFKPFQMDIKSAFLNGFIMTEVYVQQPSTLKDNLCPSYVFKLQKAIYSLKQAPINLYEWLRKILIEKGFRRGNVDTTLFIKEKGKEILLGQVYVYDIIFGSTSPLLCKKFSKLM